MTTRRTFLRGVIAAVAMAPILLRFEFDSVNCKRPLPPGIKKVGTIVGDGDCVHISGWHFDGSEIKRPFMAMVGWDHCQDCAYTISELKQIAAEYA